MITLSPSTTLMSFISTAYIWYRASLDTSLHKMRETFSLRSDASVDILYLNLYRVTSLCPFFSFSFERMTVLILQACFPTTMQIHQPKRDVVMTFRSSPLFSWLVPDVALRDFPRRLFPRILKRVSQYICPVHALSQLSRSLLPGRY